MYYSLLSLEIIYFALFPQASQSSMSFNILELVYSIFSSKPKKESKSEGENHVPTTKDPGCYSTKFYTPYTLLYTILTGKRYLFPLPSIDKWVPFQRPSL